MQLRQHAEAACFSNSAGASWVARFLVVNPAAAGWPTQFLAAFKCFEIVREAAPGRPAVNRPSPLRSGSRLTQRAPAQ